MFCLPSPFVSAMQTERRERKDLQKLHYYSLKMQAKKPCKVGAREQRIRELHEKPSPRIYVSNLRWQALRNSLQLASPTQPRGEEKPASMKANCLCSPTNHPGSFRCRIHRNTLTRNSNSLGSKLSELANKPGELQAQ
ncbi:hypothetical protein POM88_052168 [Heracleum sosnowskyi]|uniref:Uncharacterized protein n=1 Tax=Heracleum sosnowskyi TaxID=360622 RepID=A0AAD8GTK6_9APIA|nr:hypothetical protein POM88_052168 [Heracleum sosnowskyi]